MAEDTKIQLAHHKFNPWKVREKTGTRAVASESQWKLPLKWDREAAKAGERRRVFCASLADVFEDWTGPMVDSQGRVVKIDRYGADWLWHTDSQRIDGSLAMPASMANVRRRLFRLIDATQNLDWILVTKRIENALRMWPLVSDGTPSGDSHEKYLPNVWLLTSVEDQAAADTRIPALLRCRDLVPVLGLSVEPLLGPVDLLPWLFCDRCRGPHGCGQGAYETPLDNAAGGCWFRECRCSQIGWVIIGGESGRGARPCNLEWVRSIKDQCAAAGVPCFVKQLGANVEAANDSISDWLDQCQTVYAEMGMPIQGELVRLRLRDPKGGDPAEWPEDLRVREFPARRGTVGE